MEAACSIAAVAAVVGLALFMRWALRHRLRPPAPAARPAEDGLLTLIATLSRRESALALRAVLSDAGIRSTIRVPAPHRADVLVFPEDADRARAWPPPSPAGQSRIPRPGLRRRRCRSTCAPRPRSCSTKSG